MKSSKSKMEMLEKLMEIMSEDDREMDDHMYPEKGMMPEKKMKATIMADSKKGLLEGAKKLPEILSKAEKYRKMRMGSEEDSKK